MSSQEELKNGKDNPVNANGRIRNGKAVSLTCAVTSCTNRSGKPNICFYQFPKDARLRREWLLKCGRSVDWNTECAQVCSAHFSDADFLHSLIKSDPGIKSRSNILSKKAIPSKNLTNVTSVFSIEPALFDSLVDTDKEEKVNEVIIEEEIIDTTNGNEVETSSAEADDNLDTLIGEIIEVGDVICGEHEIETTPNNDEQVFDTLTCTVAESNHESGDDLAPIYDSAANKALEINVNDESDKATDEQTDACNSPLLMSALLKRNFPDGIVKLAKRIKLSEENDNDTEEKEEMEQAASADEGKAGGLMRESLLLAAASPQPPRRKKKPVIFRTDSSDFEELIDTVHFIDKSMFIKTFFEDTGKIIISAPRYFGKTVIMDMLKRFAAITTLHSTSIANYKLFRENNLTIFRDQHFFNKHFNQYPVIFIDFKRISCSDLTEILQKFREILYNSYMPYSDLVNISTLWENVLRKETFIKYCHSEYYKSLTKAEIESGYQFLARVLYKQFNRKILLLIDNYDMPIQKALLKPKAIDHETIEFIYDTISDLFNCNIIDRILINVNSKLGILPGYTNKFKIKTFLHDHPYLSYYGLHLKEVDDLFQKRGKLALRKLADVKGWYGGYRSIGSDIEIFNSLSINNFLSEKKLESYWFDCCYIPNLEEILNVYEISIIFEDLLDNKDIVIKVRKTIELKHIDILKNFIHNPSNRQTITNFTINLFLQLLHELGYLISVKSNFNNDLFLCLKIPNLELLNSFKNMMNPFDYMVKFSITQDVIQSLLISLQILKVKGEKNRFVKFTKAVQQLYCCCKAPVADYEAHALLYSIAKKVYPTIYCNLHIFDPKIFDIVIIRDDNSAVIINITFQKSCEVALAQIFNNDYYNDILDVVLVKEKVRNRIYVGINIDTCKSITVSYLINNDKMEKAKLVPA